MNAPYDIFRYSLLTALIDWRTENLVLSAWVGTPDYDPEDRTVNDIKLRGNVEAGYSLPINGTSVTMDGTAQTDQVLIPDVPIGPDVTWFTLARSNATHDLSELVQFVDEAENLPFTPNGLDIVVQPDWIQQRGWFRP